MNRDIKRLTQKVFDLVVVGGGINGAAISHMAANAGLKVALLEKGDFASGTSSKSTKLMHGGIRYLENFEFDLVQESLRERYTQFKNAPHLVKPIQFLVPVYKGDRRSLWKMKLGVLLYDFLSGKFRVGAHQFFTAEQVIEAEPQIKKDDLAGGISYYDCQMDDARLVLENVLSADQKGACVANYVEVKSFLKENGKVVGVKASDLFGSASFEVRAKRVVCATGPWNDELVFKDNPYAAQKVRTTKGAHLVYKDALTRNALLIQSRRDKRIFFVIPWMGHSLIGTTETDFEESPDQVEVTQDDIDYLISEAKRVFPKVHFDPKKIVTTFAALRPLVYKAGDPNKVSRKHEIEQSYSGVLYVKGGKYTTYRKIAQDCLKKILPSFQKNPQYFPVYGSGTIDEDLHVVSRRFDIDPEIVLFLRGKYGTRYTDVLKLTQEQKDLKERICSCSNTIRAQVAYSIRCEMAQTIGDIIDRRLGLKYIWCSRGNCRKVIEQMARRLS